jgi:GntR family galactonate operon transcriptional repressor
MPGFSRIEAPEKLHARVTRTLALRVLEAERDSQPLAFPNEADLCQQLGVSRSILRESVKVLADKGMVEVRQRLGTHANPRACWNQLDPDILNWWVELGVDAQFLRDLCEVRLAIEPTAAGFAAVRGSADEIDAVAHALDAREVELKSGNMEKTLDLEIDIHSAIMSASHSPLLDQLSRAIRRPLRAALSCTTGLRATAQLESAANRQLIEALRQHDSMKARAAAEKIVGLAMLGAEDAARRELKERSRGRQKKDSLKAVEA